MHNIPRPDAPLRVALIGAGSRGTRHYLPVFDSLKPWVELSAICDPSKSRSDEAASDWSVAGYTSVKKLARDGIAEAAFSGHSMRRAPSASR